MAKYKSGNYYQSNKIINDERFDKLPYQCIYIYQILQELEHRFTDEYKTSFFRSDEDFAKDCRMPLSTFKKYKGILVEKNKSMDNPLFIMFQTHFVDPVSGRLSYKHITAYELNDY